MTPLDILTSAPAIDLARFGTPAYPTGPAADAAPWDNRPSWHNWTAADTRPQGPVPVVANPSRAEHHRQRRRLR